MTKPSPCHKRIFEVLKDQQFHDFTDFCNGWVGGRQGDRRLREMEAWGVFHEWRFKQGTRTSQYRITKVYDIWFDFAKLPRPLRVEPSGQEMFV